MKPDLGLHYELAQLAHAAYSPPREAMAAAEELGYRTRFLSRTGSEALVAFHPERTVVAFRGTTPSSLRDLLDDASMLLHGMDPWGKAHSGFMRGRKRLSLDLVTALSTIKHPAPPLYFTGHSKGAAEATVAAAHHARHELDAKGIGGLVTFGSPRVGDKAFCNQLSLVLQDRTFRYVNNNDAVTRVPGRVCGYEHLGQLGYFDHAGKLHMGAEGLTQWRLFLDRVQGRLDALDEPGCDGMRDHGMANYVRLLEAAARG